MTSTHPTRRCRVAALLAAAAVTLAACGGDDTTTDEPATSAAPDAVAATGAPDTTTAAPSDGGDIAGAELVCPAVTDTLALASEAGWGPGAGLTDDAAKASISAQMVIALVLDDNDQTQALWDGADTIAAAGCPDEAAQLAAIYGGTTLLDILRAL